MDDVERDGGAQRKSDLLNKAVMAGSRRAARAHHEQSVDDETAADIQFGPYGPSTGITRHRGRGFWRWLLRK